MFGKLFGKKSAKVAQSYDIHQVTENAWTVHLTNEQTAYLGSNGLTDVREFTLTRGEETWKVEYSYLAQDGSWQNVQTGGIAFSDEPLESVLELLIN